MSFKSFPSLILTVFLLVCTAKESPSIPDQLSLVAQPVYKDHETSSFTEKVDLQVDRIKMFLMLERFGKKVLVDELERIEEKLDTFLAEEKFALSKFEAEEGKIWSKLTVIDNWKHVFTMSHEEKERYNFVKLRFKETSQTASYLRKFSESSLPFDRIIGSMLKANLKITHLFNLSKQLSQNIRVIKCNMLELWQTIAALGSQYKSFARLPLDKKMLFEAEEARAYSMLEELSKSTRYSIVDKEEDSVLEMGQMLTLKW